MRSGGSSAAQQTLTAEAASVLKHSLSLAGRRGHAQVTPLHVAATLLTSRSSLLRKACLKSHPHNHQPSHHHHPLHSRALELCFNVALNRLPTSPSPLLHGQPCLSNALIAALKRAQAHQRRGCIEQQQQQPLLTVKVELEQLIISILDDPSVSRVMREAGFSSTSVKNNLEDSSSSSANSSVFQCYNNCGGVFSSPCSPSPPDSTNLWHTHFFSYSSEQNPLLFSPPKKLQINPISDKSSLKQDIKLVFEVLLGRGRKRRNTVIVGDSISMTECFVSELMRRVKKGDDEVPDELKSTQFIEFPFAPLSLRFMKREEVKMKLGELKQKVESVVSKGGGVIIYTGDLKWVVDHEAADCDYGPVNHVIAEIAKLISAENNGTSANNSKATKVWLMGTASYQIYMRCQMRQPSLETQWDLQAVPVPSSGLGLSLHASSGHDSRITFSKYPSHQPLETKPLTGKEEQTKLTCCAECTSYYEKELQHLNSSHPKQLPSWLQPHRPESRSTDELFDQLRRKWNRLCQSLHQNRHSQSLIGKSFSYASSYPWWPIQNNSIFHDSNSISFIDPPLKPSHSPNLVPRFRRQQSCTIEFNFGNSAKRDQNVEPNRQPVKPLESMEVKTTLALGNSSLFGNSEKIDGLCKLLQENVPWQSEIIPSIAEAVIESQLTKQETWVLIQGNDLVGKRRLARAIAESVFGSADFLLQLNLRRENKGIPHSEIVSRAMKTNGKLVILVEDIDFADTQFVKFLTDGFERGNFGQAIFILTKDDDLTNYDDRKKNKGSLIQMTLKVNTGFGELNLDKKRKADWDFLNKTKNQRISEKEEESPPVAVGNGNAKNKDFSRQSSFNTLDLNLKAEGDEEVEEKEGEFSPISSDLTRETTTDLQSPNGFVESIENRFEINRKRGQEGEMREIFMSRIRLSYAEVFGENINLGKFSVEERVMEEILDWADCLGNRLFEKWVKEIFETSLQAARFGGKEGMDVRLCLDDNEKQILEEGYMGTCLPKNIKVAFMD